MKVKDGVQLKDLQFVMREVLINADKIWEENGKELVVTSTADSVHSAGSLHPYGLAVDFRTKYFDEVTKQKVYKKLIEKLGDRFTVISEPTHIHVQLNLQANQGVK
jgi:hypothetical protein